MRVVTGTAENCISSNHTVPYLAEVGRPGTEPNGGPAVNRSSVTDPAKPDTSATHCMDLSPVSIGLKASCSPPANTCGSVSSRRKTLVMKRRDRALAGTMARCQNSPFPYGVNCTQAEKFPDRALECWIQTVMSSSDIIL